MVGGGGSAVNSGIGGGSGYIKYSTIALTESNIIQTIKVGDYGHRSSVTIDGEVLEAEPGRPGLDGGWSGGGGPNCNCNGGSDGSDGSGAGGKGTGEKLSSFPMDSFILTPGVGGQFCSNLDGGGGGGVLVNGAGPEEWDLTQGQGFGGGGCDYDSQGNDAKNYGLRGVILLEMVP